MNPRSARAVPLEQGASRYRFDIALDDASGKAGAMRCLAAVNDLAAGREIAAPAIERRPGAPGRTVETDAEFGASLEVDLVVDEGARLATCSAPVKKGGLLIASDAAKREIH